MNPANRHRGLFTTTSRDIPIKDFSCQRYFEEAYSQPSSSAS